MKFKYKKGQPIYVVIDKKIYIARIDTRHIDGTYSVHIRGQIDEHGELVSAHDYVYPHIDEFWFGVTITEALAQRVKR
jgi:hypothetical protein